ncbi:hypothetical protein BH23PAT1_BH23PAT1_5580 [soil metagenome]
MIRKNEKGFSALVAILLVITISAVTFAGWTVYKTNQNDSDANSQQEEAQQQSSDEEKEAEDDVTSSWLLFESTAGWRMRIPDGWELRTSEGKDLVTYKSSLDYQQGTPATIIRTESTGGRGGPFLFFVRTTDVEQPRYENTGEDVAITDFTANGINGKKFIYVFREGSPSLGSPGDIEYEYRFNRNGKYVSITHHHYKDQQSVLDIVEKAVKTFEFE